MNYFSESFIELIILFLYGKLPLYKGGYARVKLKQFNDSQRSDILWDIKEHDLSSIFNFRLTADECEIDNNIRDNYKKEDEETPIIRNGMNDLFKNKKTDFMSIVMTTLEIQNNFDIEPVGWMYAIELIDQDSLALLLHSYIEAFQLDTLTCAKENFYSHKKSLEIVPYLFTDYYNDYGPDFNINKGLIRLTKPGYAQTLKAEGFDLRAIKINIRIYELILSLEEQGYLTINQANFDGMHFFLNIALQKTPKEVYDISKYWIWYGDIRVNKTDGKAFYKNIAYSFRSTKQKAFKLLCFLVANAGKKLDIEETYDSLFETEENEIVDKKAALSDYTKEIKKNFKMQEEDYSAVTFTITGENILLISNPPIK